MSVRSYIIAENLATAKELLRRGQFHDAASDDSYFIVECPGMVDYRLHALFEIVSGEKQRRFSLVYSAPGESLSRVPDSLVKLIAELPPAEIDWLAEAWIESEPPRVRVHMRPSFTKKGLKQLIDVMQEARELSKPVLLYVSV